MKELMIGGTLTTKSWLLSPVPSPLVTLTLPLVAPMGTVALDWESESIVKFEADVPLNETFVVPDHDTCELITLGAFATTGNEASFKTHARRLVKEDVDVSALRQAVLVTFAATATFSQIIAALRWIDDVVEEM